MDSFTLTGAATTTMHSELLPSIFVNIFHNQIIWTQAYIANPLADDLTGNLLIIWIRTE